MVIFFDRRLDWKNFDSYSHPRDGPQSFFEADSIDVKTTILGHEAAPPQSAAEIHRFRFELNDGANPHDEYVSLRTAQVLVAALDDGNAFLRMLQEIVRTDAKDYDRLIGLTFDDRQGETVIKQPRSSADLNWWISTCRWRLEAFGPNFFRFLPF